MTVEELVDYVPLDPKALVARTSPLFVTRPDTDDELEVRRVWSEDVFQARSAGFSVSRGDRWLDAFAGIGAFSVLASKLGAELVVSIEPDAERAAMLKRNVFLNDVVGPGAVNVRAHPWELVELFGLDAVKLDVGGGALDVLAAPAPARVRKLAIRWSFEDDRRLETLERVIRRLEARFAEVRTSRRLPSSTVWPFWPRHVYVYAWNRGAR